MNTLHFSLNDSVFSITDAGILTASNSSLSSYLGTNSYMIKEISINTMDPCKGFSSFTLPVLIISAYPFTNFSTINTQCFESTNCSFNQSSYITTNGFNLTSYTLISFPTEGTVNTNLTSMI